MLLHTICFSIWSCTCRRRAVLVLGMLAIPPVCPAPPAAAAIVLNEIYYDPPGPDAGYEWVELYNNGSAALSLEAVRLESGNGSRPNQWRHEWAGGPEHWIEAGGTFTIGGPYQGRPADVYALLNLQNGPDGARLLLGALVLDTVGWGPLEFPEYYEGVPAPLVPAGYSLARRRDGVDTDINLDDFERARPTPGRRNRPDVDLEVRLVRPGRRLPIPPGGGSASARIVLRNLGLGSVDLRSIDLELDGRPIMPGRGSHLGFLEGGDGIEIPVYLAPKSVSGLQEWSVRARTDRDAVPENDRDTLRLWAGPSPLVISELLQKPPPGGSEWIELTAVGDGVAGLAGWTLMESGNRAARMAEGSLQPGEACVVAQDPAAAAWSVPSALREWDGRWPSLRNTAGSSGAADSVFLLDPEGHIRDWAAIPQAETNRSWVRVGPVPGSCFRDAWVLSERAGGTPGVAEWPEPVAAVSPGLRAAPPGVSLRRDGAGVWLTIPPELFPGVWQASIWNLQGRQVWRTGGRETDRLAVWRRWNGDDTSGRPCAAGLYVLELRVEPEAGAPLVERSTLVLGR